MDCCLLHTSLSHMYISWMCCPWEFSYALCKQHSWNAVVIVCCSHQIELPKAWKIILFFVISFLCSLLVDFSRYLFVIACVSDSLLVISLKIFHLLWEVYPSIFFLTQTVLFNVPSFYFPFNWFQFKSSSYIWSWRSIDIFCFQPQTLDH